MPPRSPSGPRRAGKPRRRRTVTAAGTINIAESGATETAERLERLVTRAEAPSTIKAVVAPLEDAERRLFREAGQSKWKPTKAETTAEKRAKGLRSEPMRATDRLFDSLTNSQAKGAIRNPLRRNTQFRFGSRLVEGVMQQRAGRDALAIDQKGVDQVVDALRYELLR